MSSDRSLFVGFRLALHGQPHRERRSLMLNDRNAASCLWINEWVGLVGTQVLKGGDIMSFQALVKEIRPLSRIEKLHLIEEISKMLREEEVPKTYFISEAEYPVFTPVNQEKAAGQLQEFIESQKP